MAGKENSLKRLFENVQEASFINLTNGEKFNIIDGQDFLIGRSRDCSLLIEELYISRVQCVVKYENNHFVLYDGSSSSGTFFNCARMNKKDSPLILQHGDIVSFGDTKQFKYIFKFDLATNSGKKFKSKDLEAMENLAKKNKQLQKDIIKLDLTMTKLSKDYNNLKENMQTKISEFQKKISDIIAVTERHFNTLEKTKYCIDVLKSQIHSQIEDNFQCSICNEIVLKSTIANCNHTFCESCITTWLVKSKLCPVCRALISSTNNTLAVDNFISDVFELLGGPMKAQRDALLTERKIITSVRVRSRLNVNRQLQERTRSTIRFAPRLDNRRAVEVVDLT